MKKILIMISPHNWYSHVMKNKVNRPLKLMEAFCEKDFFDINLLVSRVHPRLLFNSKNEKRDLLKKGIFYKLFLDKEKNLYYLEHCFPFGFFEEKLFPRVLNRIVSDLGEFEKYLWICDPKSTYLFSNLVKLNIFDAYDDWYISPLFKNKKRHLKFIKKGYKKANELADLVFANTKYMGERYFKNHDNVRILSNSSSINNININHFENIRDKNVIGYVGNIHSRINLDIIEGILDRFKDVELVFLGENNLQTERFNQILNKYKNLKLLGNVEYSELPSYLKSFDVSIVPHKVDNYTLSQDSMKIYDNLACGNAIVTTRIPPTDQLPDQRDFIFVADSVEEFNIQIEKALFNRGNEEIMQERIDYIKNNNWNKRAEFVYNAIQEVRK